MKKIRVRIPATTTNLGSGFDCLGLALSLYNTVELEVGDGKTTVTVKGEGEEELHKPESNWVLLGIRKLYQKIGKHCPTLHLTLINKIPFSRGLGSSAAAYLGGLVSANLLSGKKLSNEEILELAVDREGHPDNVIPAYTGGLVISCRTKEKTLWIKCEKPKIPKMLVIIPDLPMGTSESRRILPKKVPFEDAVHNLTRTALLVGALNENRWDLLRNAMEDKLHQQYRDTKHKLFARSITAAYKAGALGAAMSGSGSSILAFVPNKNTKVGPVIQRIFAEQKIPVRILPLKVDNRGLTVLS